MLLAACALLASGPASAQIPVGPAFQVDTLGAERGFPMIPAPRAISMAPDGRFVVTWMTPVSSYVSGIAARRFGATGLPAGDQFLVNPPTSPPDFRFGESVAVDGAGTFVVAWSSDDRGALLGRRFEAGGVPLGGEFQINQGTEFQHAMVAMRPGGELIAVWSDGPGAGGNVIRARRYDAAGAPLGGEFQVHTVTTAGSTHAPAVAYDAAGDFVVVWAAGGREIRGRRFAADGTPQAGEFVVTAAPYAYVGRPRVARATDGSFVVAWQGPFGAGLLGIVARGFDPQGLPMGGEFPLHVSPTFSRDVDLAVDADGDFVAVWEHGYAIQGRRFDAGGNARPVFAVSGPTGGPVRPAVAGDPAGNFVVTWHAGPNPEGHVYARRYAGGLMAAGLSVDYEAGASSDGNGVLEPNEEAKVAPSWLNGEDVALTLTGALFSYGGPGPIGHYPPPTDTLAGYGTLSPGDTRSCVTTSDCYAVAILDIGARPALHWDATLGERLAPVSLAAEKTWTLHVGDSFGDVPRASVFYRFVETLLHRSVTGGCTASTYCPSSSATREQMAVFVLVAKDGPGNGPAACGATPMFADVPASSPFCPWIEELARRGAVAGCGGGNYCPSDPVSREQMAVFVLRTVDPALAPPACTTPMFGDVPASSPFCRWIEELARRGVVAGCGGGSYCPTASVTREQMAVFVARGFGLELYGP